MTNGRNVCLCSDVIKTAGDILALYIQWDRSLCEVVLEAQLERLSNRGDDVLRQAAATLDDVTRTAVYVILCHVRYKVHRVLKDHTQHWLLLNANIQTNISSGNTCPVSSVAHRRPAPSPPLFSALTVVFQVN